MHIIIFLFILTLLLLLYLNYNTKEHFCKDNCNISAVDLKKDKDKFILSIETNLQDKSDKQEKPEKSEKSSYNKTFNTYDDVVKFWNFLKLNNPDINKCDCKLPSLESVLNVITNELNNANLKLSNNSFKKTDATTISKLADANLQTSKHLLHHIKQKQRAIHDTKVDEAISRLNVHSRELIDINSQIVTIKKQISRNNTILLDIRDKLNSNISQPMKSTQPLISENKPPMRPPEHELGTMHYIKQLLKNHEQNIEQIHAKYSKELKRKTEEKSVAKPIVKPVVKPDINIKSNTISKIDKTIKSCPPCTLYSGSTTTPVDINEVTNQQVGSIVPLRK